MLVLKVKEEEFNLDHVAFVFVDCQNDFITGTLGDIKAQKALKVIENVAEIPMKYAYATADTHYNEEYLNSREGQKLPIKHCIIDDYENDGWDLPFKLDRILSDKTFYAKINKYSFGSLELPIILKDIENLECIVFVGFCTDICVISNVLVTQAGFENEIPIVVIEDGCAGTSPEKHKAALDVMRSCQIDVVNYDDIEVLPVVGEVFSKE